MFETQIIIGFNDLFVFALYFSKTEDPIVG